MRLYIAIILTISLSFCVCAKNNVCRQVDDYRRMHTSRNCFYNPNLGLSGRDLITWNGFPFEEYTLTSPDGYILTLFRIPNNSTAQKGPILMQHGFGADSTPFLVSSDGNSLAFFMSRSGYDVWLANARGTPYSKTHLNYTIEDPEYWNFSFHEMGVYDMPMITEFILAKTGQKMHYIGHSMGTSISFIYASLKPKHANAHLKNIVAVAPIALMGHTRGLARFFNYFIDIAKNVLKSMKIYGIVDSPNSVTVQIRKLCVKPPFFFICLLFMSSTMGYDPEELIPEALPLLLASFPVGASLKSFEHFSQLINAQNRFQFFDYGPKQNQILYNSPQPPEYPVGRITIPMCLFYGPNDLLSVEADVLALYTKLGTRKYISRIFHFAHSDFLTGRHASQFFKQLLSCLK